MTTQKKKVTRRKQYRNMSVTELVTAKKELMEKMEQIDSILNKAVEAMGARVTPKVAAINKPAYDPAFGNPTNYGTQSMVSAPQVAISNEAPIMTPRPGNAPDQSSGFTIFDADAFARKQAAEEEQYLAQNPGSVVPPEYDFNSQAVTAEIDSLKEQIQGAKNARDTETDN